MVNTISLKDASDDLLAESEDTLRRLTIERDQFSARQIVVQTRQMFKILGLPIRNITRENVTSMLLSGWGAVITEQDARRGKPEDDPNDPFG